MENHAGTYHKAIGQFLLQFHLLQGGAVFLLQPAQFSKFQEAARSHAHSPASKEWHQACSQALQ